MRNISFILSVTIFIALTSCKDEDVTPDNNPSTSTQKCLTTKYKYYRNGSIDWFKEYAYDSANRLSKHKDFSFTGSSSTQTGYTLYLYDSTNQLEKEKHYAISSSLVSTEYLYEYNSLGQIIKLTSQYETQPGVFVQNNSRHLYEYNSANQVVKYSRYSTGMYPDVVYTFDFNSSGNITVATEYRSWGGTGPLKIEEITEYLYDKKPNPLFKIGTPLWHPIYYSRNNITKQIIKSPSGTEISSKVYNYKYNTQNYPSEFTHDSYYKEEFEYKCL